MMKNIKLMSCAFVVILLSACEESKVPEKQIQLKPNNDLVQRFEVWKETQDQAILEQYQHYLTQQLKSPPNLFELSYNQHIKREECLVYQFAIAPQAQWENIVKPLQLLEKLHRNRIIPNYKIVSIYRSQQANRCSRGVQRSKHLSNHAVDLQLLDHEGNLLVEQDSETLLQLCRFWKREGRKHNMGLGTYANNKYHVDTSGYRTWGQNYKRESSLCLKQDI